MSLMVAAGWVYSSSESSARSFTRKPKDRYTTPPSIRIMTVCSPRREVETVEDEVGGSAIKL